LHHRNEPLQRRAMRLHIATHVEGPRVIDHRRGLEVTGEAVRLARDEQLTLLAAGVAFYGFISLVPLMLLALGIAASIGGEALAARLTAAASDVLTADAQELLAETLVDDTGAARERPSSVFSVCSGARAGSSAVSIGPSHRCTALRGEIAARHRLGRDDRLRRHLAGSHRRRRAQLVIRFVTGFGLSIVGQLFVVLGWSRRSCHCTSSFRTRTSAFARPHRERSSPRSAGSH